MTNPKPENVNVFKWAVFAPDGTMIALHRDEHQARRQRSHSYMGGDMAVRPVKMVRHLTHHVAQDAEPYHYHFGTYVNIVAEIDGEQTPS